MKSLLLISAILINLGWSHAYPGGPEGVGAFAYQDSTGNRYGGTYGLKDGQVYNIKGDDFPASQFSPNTFQDLDDFFPEYFRNLENLLQEAFQTNFEHQRVAYNAAKKAFDLTSNQAGYIPNFNFGFTSFNRFPDFIDFGGATSFAMPNIGGPNTHSAFASGYAGPGFTHQVAAINPPNPQMRNVNVMSRSDDGNAGGNKPRYQSVSSSSYASSSNINGKTTSQRRAETVVNNDGKITRYEVHN